MVTILPALAAYSQSAGIPIEHFIFIIQENHSFDNYFGTNIWADGILIRNSSTGLSGRSAGQQTIPAYEDEHPHDWPQQLGKFSWLMAQWSDGRVSMVVPGS